MKIKINLKDKICIKDVLNEIQDKVGFNLSEKPNFAGSVDELRSLDSESSIWRENLVSEEKLDKLFYENRTKWWEEQLKHKPNLKELQLIFNNISDFKQKEPENYKNLITTLSDLTDPKNRYDKVIFSYEVHDGEMPS